MRRTAHRRVPVPAKAAEAVRRYLVEGRPLLAHGGLDQGRLLLSRRGKPLDGDMVWQIVERVGLRAHVRAHPHALRRAIATGLARAGTNLEAVRQLLGHARLSTTAIYVEADRSDLHRAIEKLDDRRE